MSIRSRLLRLTDDAGLRFLARRRGPFVAAVITMALAPAATSAVFSAVDPFLLPSLGIPHPDRVVTISPSRVLPGRGLVRFSDAWPNYELLRSTQRSFDEVTATRTATASWD